MSFPHIRVIFSASTEVIRAKAVQKSSEEELDLACLIRLCLDEFLLNAIISPGDDLTATIRPYVLGKTVGHWTVEPCIVVALIE